MGSSRSAASMLPSALSTISGPPPPCTLCTHLLLGTLLPTWTGVLPLLGWAGLGCWATARLPLYWVSLDSISLPSCSSHCLAPCPSSLSLSPSLTLSLTLSLSLLSLSTQSLRLITSPSWSPPFLFFSVRAAHQSAVLCWDLLHPPLLLPSSAVVPGPGLHEIPRLLLRLGGPVAAKSHTTPPRPPALATFSPPVHINTAWPETSDSTRPDSIDRDDRPSRRPPRATTRTPPPVPTLLLDRDSPVGTLAARSAAAPSCQTWTVVNITRSTAHPQLRTLHHLPLAFSLFLYDPTTCPRRFGLGSLVLWYFPSCRRSSHATPLTLHCRLITQTTGFLWNAPRVTARQLTACRRLSAL